MVLRLLVIEGNTLAGRLRIAKWAGATPAESYAAVLRTIAPAAIVDICMPADGDGATPQPLDAYDGVAITGSALTIYQREIESLRQIDFVREVFALGIPMFGSCWGLQLATVAAGGEVALNPAGRGRFRAQDHTDPGGSRAPHACDARRRVRRTGHSQRHRDPAPQGSIVTAYNAMSEVQAAEIWLGRGVFWGVQYHPEYGLHDVAAVIRRYGQTLLAEAFLRHCRPGT
jgi:GMP synthase (glutamine-hydrolysing)